MNLDEFSKLTGIPVTHVTPEEPEQTNPVCLNDDGTEYHLRILDGVCTDCGEQVE